MSKIAVIKTGGRQHKVITGQRVVIGKIPQKKDEGLVFQDLLSGQSVKAKVLEHFKAKKIRVFKFRRKTRYTRTRGHRQDQTRISIEEIK